MNLNIKLLFFYLITIISQFSLFYQFDTLDNVLVFMKGSDAGRLATFSFDNSTDNYIYVIVSITSLVKDRYISLKINSNYTFDISKFCAVKSKTEYRKFKNRAELNSEECSKNIISAKKKTNANKMEYYELTYSYNSNDSNNYKSIAFKLERNKESSFNFYKMIFPFASEIKKGSGGGGDSGSGGISGWIWAILIIVILLSVGAALWYYFIYKKLGQKADIINNNETNEDYKYKKQDGNSSINE